MDNNISQQMPKGLFIGLGGTGVATLSKLKAKIFHDAYQQNKAKMDDDCRFIFYDSDLGSKKFAREDVEINRLMGQEYSVIDESEEYISAASVKPYSRYKSAKNNPNNIESGRLLEWVIDPDKPGHVALEDKDLGQGCGANRQKGRFGIAATIGNFETKIKNHLNALKKIGRQGENQKVVPPHIWVFASSNGGTSSSALLDVLYLTNRVYRGIYQTDPYLRLVMYMPKPFIDRNKNSKTSYTLGGYATLWELNAFRLDRTQFSDGKKFGAFAVRPDINSSWKEDPWPVCTYVMAVDIESEAGKLNDLNQMIDNTANFCYYIHSSCAGDSMVSNLDNDFDTDKDFYKKTNHPQNEKFGWAYFVVGAGYKTLAKADNYLKEYVRKRFRYDLFSYGLLGKKYLEILPDKSARIAAEKKFANDYILKHLINFNDVSERETLYAKYSEEFNTVVIPFKDNEKISKDQWNEAPGTFIEDCKKVRQRLDSEFNVLRDRKLEAIKNSVFDGIENCIVHYGLEYTWSLLDAVDDKFLQTEVIDELKKKPTLSDLQSTEEKINEIVSNKRPRRTENISELYNAMQEYRNNHIKAIAYEHIKDIIEEITTNSKDHMALLECLRRGDKPSHMGVQGIINAFNESLTPCTTDYFKTLVDTFKCTKKEPCTDYFPRVCDMVDENSNWVKKNKFEELYSKVVLLDRSSNARPYNDYDNCMPPQRYSSDKYSLAYAISEIKKLDGHQNLFADMAWGDDNTFRELRVKLEDNINDYVDRLLNREQTDLLNWLNNGLEAVFDEKFQKKDGTVDIVARRKYVNEFKANIPVFYPTRSDRTGDVTIGERYLYIGVNDAFAEKMGYVASDETQYLQDESMKNQFLVCKIEVGHNFYDYKYFGELNDKYEENIDTIKSGGSACHIHQKFLTRDIVKAFESRKAKRFDDFIKLCWFDSYFEMLNNFNSTKRIVEGIFGEATTDILNDNIQRGKKSAKTLVDGSDILDDDLLDDSLSDDIDSLELADVEEEDISIDVDDINDEMEVDDNLIEEGLTTGYTPIVTINESLNVEIKTLQLSEIAGVIAFKDGEGIESNITGTSLLQIRKEIIKNLDNVDYANMYFANFSTKFRAFDDEMRKKLVSIHRVYRDKVKAIFIKKISPILKKRKVNDAKDKEVFLLLNRCVKKCYGQDIFN